MSGLLVALTAVPSPSPSVTPAGGGSPGFLGFVVTFALALAAAGIFLSLTRHLRIVDRRAREQAAQDEAEPGTAVSGGGSSATATREGTAPANDLPRPGQVPPADDEHRA